LGKLKKASAVSRKSDVIWWCMDFPWRLLK